MLGLLFLALLPLIFLGIEGSGSDGAASDDDPPGPDDTQGGGSDPFAVRLGGAGDDSLTGNPTGDLLQGGDGRDTLRGLDGDDLLSGQGGNDLLVGGFGKDVVSGGEGQDVLLGQGGADLLLGNGGNDALEGERGADLLVDYSGSDTLLGGGGNDTLSAIDLTDRLTFADVWPEATDPLDTASFEAELSRRFGAALSPAQISQIAADVRGGDAVASAPDVLDGGFGDDVLFGDNGDTMAGGGGANHFFVYTDPARAADNAPVVITDLDPARDRLTLSVEGDGTGALTFGLDEFGTGTAVRYDGDVVARIVDRRPGTLQSFLPTIDVQPRVAA